MALTGCVLQPYPDRMKPVLRLGLLLAFLPGACQGDGHTPEQAAAAEQRVQAAAKKLGAELKARLQAAMQQGGPDAAVRVCADEAQAITAQAQTEDVAVGRRSLRMRNPKNTAPAWVDAWLTEHGERPLEGLGPRFEVVDGTARFLRPIGVDAVCLLCHGPAESIQPSVKTLLAENYPDDAATGYALGDLRGVVWAETKL